MADIDLAFLVRQMGRLLDGQSQIRDDITVVMARLDRIETMIRGDRDELRATFTEMTAIAPSTRSPGTPVGSAGTSRPAKLNPKAGTSHGSACNR